MKKFLYSLMQIITVVGLVNFAAQISLSNPIWILIYFVAYILLLISCIFYKEYN